MNCSLPFLSRVQEYRLCSSLTLFHLLFPDHAIRTQFHYDYGLGQRCQVQLPELVRCRAARYRSHPDNHNQWLLGQDMRLRMTGGMFWQLRSEGQQ